MEELIKSHAVLFEKPGDQTAAVTVCISLYNYENYILDTLETVYKQTLAVLDLVIVDDRSGDESAVLAQRWLEQRQSRFNTVRLVRHLQNSGLAAARNTAIGLVETPFVFILDADNHLYPRCLSRCLETLETSEAAFAYPLIEQFGAMPGVMGNRVWNRERLARVNYIDAMALVRRSVLLQVGGYTRMPYPGWEDYDLWCKLAEQDHFGVLIPEFLARYRVHPTSMLRTTTNRSGKIEVVIDDMMQRHPWLKLRESEV